MEMVEAFAFHPTRLMSKIEEKTRSRIASSIDEKNPTLSCDQGLGAGILVVKKNLTAVK